MPDENEKSEQNQNYRIHSLFFQRCDLSSVLLGQE